MCFREPWALHWRQRPCCSFTMQQWLSKATPVYCLAQGLYFVVDWHFWYSTTWESMHPAHGSCTSAVASAPSARRQSTARTDMDISLQAERRGKGGVGQGLRP